MSLSEILIFKTMSTRHKRRRPSHEGTPSFRTAASIRHIQFPMVRPTSIRKHPVLLAHIEHAELGPPTYRATCEPYRRTKTSTPLWLSRQNGCPSETNGRPF